MSFFVPVNINLPSLNLLSLPLGTAAMVAAASLDDYFFCGGATAFYRYEKNAAMTYKAGPTGTLLILAANNGRVFAATSPATNVIWTSDDFGNTWDARIAAATVGGATPFGLAVNSSGVAFATFSGNQGYYSTDNGDTWNASASFAAASFSSPSLAGQSQMVRWYDELGAFICLSGGTKLGTSPDGNNWTFYDATARGDAMPNVVSQEYFNNLLYVQDTRGNIWNGAGPSSPFTQISATTFYNQLTASSSTQYDGKLLIAYNNRLYAGHKNGALQVSDDGVIFKPLNNDVPISSQYDIQASAEFNGELWTVGSTRILRTLTE